MKSWYTIKAAAEGGQSTMPVVEIFDDIGSYGVSARAFISAIRAIDAPEFRLEVTSLGGSLIDAIAMYNAILAHPAKVHGVVMGLAASAATVPLMACDTVAMPDNAFLMVHYPLYDFVFDVNAKDLRGMADDLDKFGGALTRIYAGRTGLSEEAVGLLLAGETYLDAHEAKAQGFIDEVLSSVSVTASVDPERVPDRIRARIVPPAPAPAPPPAAIPLAQVLTEAAARHGMLAHVGAWLSAGRLVDEAGATALVEEAVEIRALCDAANQSELADGFIKACTPLAAVELSLLTIKAQLDAALPVNSRSSSTKVPADSAPQSALKASSVYAARRNQNRNRP
ncbi:head maturation protease, ClpP-related [Chitinibacteraceae bacterium HSL-7]